MITQSNHIIKVFAKGIVALETESSVCLFFFSQNSSSSDFLYKTSAQIESFRFEVEND